MNTNDDTNMSNRKLTRPERLRATALLLKKHKEGGKLTEVEGDFLRDLVQAEKRSPERIEMDALMDKWDAAKAQGYDLTETDKSRLLALLLETVIERAV